ncbi:uncharacterized protein LOC144580655 [Callithrix jacchus]
MVNSMSFANLNSFFENKETDASGADPGGARSGPSPDSGTRAASRGGSAARRGLARQLRGPPPRQGQASPRGRLPGADYAEVRGRGAWAETRSSRGVAARRAGPAPPSPPRGDPTRPRPDPDPRPTREGLTPQTAPGPTETLALEMPGSGRARRPLPAPPRASAPSAPTRSCPRSRPREPSPHPSPVLRRLPQFSLDLPDPRAPRPPHPALSQHRPLADPTGRPSPPSPSARVPRRVPPMASPPASSRASLPPACPSAAPRAPAELWDRRAQEVAAAARPRAEGGGRRDGGRGRRAPHSLRPRRRAGPGPGPRSAAAGAGPRRRRRGRPREEQVAAAAGERRSPRPRSGRPPLKPLPAAARGRPPAARGRPCPRRQTSGRPGPRAALGRPRSAGRGAWESAGPGGVQPGSCAPPATRASRVGLVRPEAQVPSRGSLGGAGLGGRPGGWGAPGGARAGAEGRLVQLEALRTAAPTGSADLVPCHLAVRWITGSSMV